MPTVLVGLAVLCFGCRADRAFLQPAEIAKPLAVKQLVSEQIPTHEAEAVYARAIQLEEDNNVGCLDLYLQCCRQLWPKLIANSDGSFGSRDSDLYRSSVGRFVEVAHRLGRFNAVDGVSATSTQVPIQYSGLEWQPTELRRFITVGDYKVPAGVEPKTQSGIGTPMVALFETERRFVQPAGAVAISVLVRPREDGTPVIDVINPFLIRHFGEQADRLPIAFDLTAPMAHFAERFERAGITGFLRPAKVEASSGLEMVEPYQPGKIPLVFVHGLASDPMTWASMANELCMHPEVLARYQFWLFSYPTGEPFPIEAAKLRRQLLELRNTIYPKHEDEALDNMVLVGHSMGGLMSKLQITSSGERMAKAVFAKPVDQLTLSPEMQQHLESTFFFEPSPHIRRVIFIGTPHRGSSIASKPIGRLASSLVRDPAALVAGLADFAKSNSDAMVDGRTHIPTSVDLLRPGNPVLETIYELPVNPSVIIHSLIGTAHGGKFGKERGDGVVSVRSARHPGVASELLVDASHTKIHHHPDAIREVVSILNRHSLASDVARNGPPH